MSHSDIAHRWAQGQTGSSKSGNMLYDADKIYSYGKHFCIARLLPSGVVVFGTHKYSNSTAKHQYKVRHAITHRETVYCYDPDRDARYNRDQAQGEAISLITDADTKPRIRELTRAKLRRDAVELIENFNAYLDALPKAERKGVKPISLEGMGELVEQAARVAVLQRQQDEANKKKKAAQQLAKAGQWRAHIFNGYLGDIPTMLRLSTDKTEVETSRGASIPVSHAKRLWPLVENCRKVGMPLRGRDVRLGHYTLNEIKDDGSIVVGCHNIGFNEIEGIAHELGLTDTSESQRAFEGKKE